MRNSVHCDEAAVKNTRVHRFGTLNRKLYLSGLLLPITSSLYPPPHEKGCWGGLKGEASRAIANLKAANICSTLEKQAFHT